MQLTPLQTNQIYQWLNEFGISDYFDSLQFGDYQKGRRIHSCQGLIHILEGEIRVLSSSLGGKELTLFSFTQGETCIISASCALPNLVLEVGFETMCHTVFALLPTNLFPKLQDIPLFQTKIQSILNTRLTQTLNVLNQTAFTPLFLRVKNLLLSFQQEVIYITHEEIANHLGSTREAITRILKELQTQGEIQLQRGKILLLRREKISNQHHS